MSGDAQSAGQIDWRRLRVLLVDSDVRFQSWVQSVLLHTGVNNFHTATAGDKAFEILGRYTIDICLVDLFIDSMAAARFLRELRNPKKSPVPDVWVILLSKSGDQRLLREACEAGIENVVRKPISQNDFLRRISNTVASPRRIIWVDTYVGPDRRHVENAYYNGPERRGKSKSSRAAAPPSDQAAEAPKKSAMGPAIERAEKKKPLVRPTIVKAEPSPTYALDPSTARIEPAVKLVREEAISSSAEKLEPIADDGAGKEIIPSAAPHDSDEGLILQPAEMRDNVDEWSSALDELADRRKGAESASDYLPAHDDEEDQFRVETDDSPIAVAGASGPGRAVEPDGPPIAVAGASAPVRAVEPDEQDEGAGPAVQVIGTETADGIIERVEEIPIAEILQYHQLWLDTRGEEGDRAELTGEDLAGYDFSDANLTNANLRDADCSETVFTNANLEAADLRGATLNTARCRGTNFNVTKMRRVDLRLSNMKGRPCGAPIYRVPRSKARPSTMLT